MKLLSLTVEYINWTAKTFNMINSKILLAFFPFLTIVALMQISQPLALPVPQNLTIPDYLQKGMADYWLLDHTKTVTISHTQCS